MTGRALMGRVPPPVRLLCAAAAIVASVAVLPTPAADDVTFTDVTKQSGISFSHVSAPDKKYILESMSGGVALFDFDKDGLLDIYFVNSLTVSTAAEPRGARSELWRNRGDGTFSDVTDKAGVGYPGWGMGAVAADFDNDGWDDLYVTCYGANKLYRNNGDGTFWDVTQKAGVGDARWSTGAAFADYDRDGWLDLFVANYADVRLDQLPEFGKGKFCEFRGVPVQCGPRGLGGSGDSLYRNRGASSSRFSRTSTTLSIGTTRASSSPTSRSPRKQQRRAFRTSAGARTFSTTTTTAGSICWSSTDTSIRRWSGPGSPPGMPSASCSTATLDTGPSLKPRPRQVQR